MDVLQHKFPKLIRGEFITLSKVMLCDAEFIYRLRTSPVAQYLNCPPDYSVEKQIQWQQSRSNDEVNYIIYNNDRDPFRVGMVSIYDCDWTNKISSLGRLLLHENFAHKSTPYGLEAMKMVYGYVFNVMGFRKVYGPINTKNERMYSLQKYLGSVDEGCFKGHVLLNGEPQDLYYLAVFKEGFPAYEAKIDSLLNKFRNGQVL